MICFLFALKFIVLGFLTEFFLIEFHSYEVLSCFFSADVQHVDFSLLEYSLSDLSERKEPLLFFEFFYPIFFRQLFFILEKFFDEFVADLLMSVLKALALLSCEQFLFEVFYFYERLDESRRGEIQDLHDGLLSAF